MRKGLISVIIPVYNRSDVIGETLDSLLKQTYQNWESIIVDDGSTDYISELMTFYCERDNRIHYYERPQTMSKGANSCRNYGFSLSNGEFVQWFDSDDVMLPNSLKIKVDNFTPELDLVITSGYYCNEKLKVISSLAMDLKPTVYRDLIFWKKHIITGSVMFKKIFLQGKKLFNNRITRGQEAEFFSRIFFNLPVRKYKILGEPHFLYRQHKDSKTVQDKFNYNKSFKSSRSFISVSNFKRSRKLSDPELLNYIYKELLFLYFEAIENNHFKNSYKVLRGTLPTLWYLNKKLFLQWLIFGVPMILKGKVEQRHRIHLDRDLIKNN